MRTSTGITSSLLALIMLTGCGGSADEPEAAAPSTKQESEPAPDPWPKRLKIWEKENDIPDREWFDTVKVREVRMNALWIETSLPNDAEAAAYANGICGGYSTIAFEYPKIDIVTVRAGTGHELFKCGPGA